jgi:hypothetical protein
VRNQPGVGRWALGAGMLDRMNETIHMVAFLERGSGEVPATELNSLILLHDKFAIMGRQVEMLLLRIINVAQVNSREASDGFDIH